MNKHDIPDKMTLRIRNKATIHTVLYDMDGTLTVPTIDWDEVRRDIGVPEGMFILEYIDSLNRLERKKAVSILHAHEDNAAEGYELNPGVEQVLHVFEQENINQILVTNNRTSSVKLFMSKCGCCFDHVVTRDDGIPKPSGDLLLKALSAVECAPDNAVYIGNSRFDRMAADDAGIRFIFYDRYAGPADTDRISKFDQIPAVLGLEPKIRRELL